MNFNFKYMKMYNNTVFSFLMIVQLLSYHKLFSQTKVNQVEIGSVKNMPPMPAPYKMKAWKMITKKQDSLLYNFNAKGSFLPLIWWDTNKVNFPIKSSGLPSYVGSLNSKRYQLFLR